MKLKTFVNGSSYVTPSIVEVSVASESILCMSGTVESFGFVDDADGWDEN